MNSDELKNNGEMTDSYFLKCFDFAQNPIVIFNSQFQLIFANEAFCKLYNITSREKTIGKTIGKIMAEGKIKAYPIGSKRPKLKMYEVIRDGIEVLDWNVRLEYEDHPNEAQILATDMYPIKDSSGTVTGMFEIYRSHEQEIKSARKILGLSAEFDFNSIIGYSNSILSKIEKAKQFAKSSANILITGESGVGKELFAQAIHNYSSRSKGPFVALNCASFPSELIESELFGYIEGAFTGASKKGQTGKIEIANGGTLFLDEIGELPYYFQPKLLRVLESWTITKVGDTQPIPVDVRLVAATNRDLEKMVEDGLFRQDLYYRLQVLNVEIPPLRERKEDIVPIAEHFLKQFASSGSNDPKTLTSDAEKILKQYDWPGNIRELKNTINRVEILSPGSKITAEYIMDALTSKDSSVSRAAAAGNDYDQYSDDQIIQMRKDAIDAAYADLLRDALEITGGNRKNAAEIIGVSRKTFYRMMEKYHIL